MSLQAKLAALERQAGASKDTGILVLTGDADRAKLVAMQGGRVYILADPADRPLVEAAKRRGVKVTARYIAGDVLGAV